MAIDEKNLNKGQIRKLTVLRKSLGDDLADDVFAKWLMRHSSPRAMEERDPVAQKIVKAIAKLESDKSFRLGNKGYTIRRARGKGASGFIVSRNK